MNICLAAVLFGNVGLLVIYEICIIIVSVENRSMVRVSSVRFKWLGWYNE